MIWKWLFQNDAMAWAQWRSTLQTFLKGKCNEVIFQNGGEAGWQIKKMFWISEKGNNKF